MATLSAVLLVEDNPQDTTWFRLAYREAAIPNPLILAAEGREALPYLGPPPVQCLLPALLVTDLHMPGMNGLALLAWLQTRPHLHHLPAVVLTDSDDPDHRLRALSLGARDYALKPRDFPAMVELLREWQRLWLSPPGPPEAQTLPRAGVPDPPSPGPFRVLLRRKQSYLQRSGEWRPRRRTAREFAASTVAYWWALEQGLSGVEVLLAFNDPANDYTLLRVSARGHGSN